MKITCLGCGEHEFHVDVPTIELVQIITFVCPKCGEQTSVNIRKGGGFVVAIDRYNKGETAKEGTTKKE